MRWPFWLLYWALLAPLGAALPTWLVAVLFNATLAADSERGLRLHHSAEEEVLFWGGITFVGALWVLYSAGFFVFLLRRRVVDGPRPLAALESFAGGLALLCFWCSLFIALVILR